MYKYPKWPSAGSPSLRLRYLLLQLPPSYRPPWPTSGEHPCPAPTGTVARLLSCSSPLVMQIRTSGLRPGSWSPFKVRIICLTHTPCIWTGSDTTLWALDLVEFPVVAIDADESVEVACDVRRFCSCYVCRFRVHIGSLGPLVIRCPLFGRPSKGFLVSRPI